MAEQATQQQQQAEILEQQRREQREQSVTQEDRLERVESLLNKLLSKPQPSPPPTYAAALHSGLAPPPDRDIPTRLNREILVQRSNTTEGLHPEALVRRVNNTKIRGRVIAARRLPSGDIVLTLDSTDTKRQMEADTTWLQALGEGS